MEKPIIRVGDGAGIQILTYILERCRQWGWTFKQTAVFLQYVATKKYAHDRYLEVEELDHLRINFPEWALEYVESVWYVGVKHGD